MEYFVYGYIITLIINATMIHRVMDRGLGQALTDRFGGFIFHVFCVLAAFSGPLLIMFICGLMFINLVYISFLYCKRIAPFKVLEAKINRLSCEVRKEVCSQILNNLYQLMDESVDIEDILEVSEVQDDSDSSTSERESSSGV